jgi:hypothetical protein
MRDSLDVFQKNYEDNKNSIPNDIFDENAFSNDNKVVSGIKDASFEEENWREENLQKSYSNNLRPAKNQKKPEFENEAEEDFEKFKSNFANFYRGYTPDDYSKRKYPQAKRILMAYENIKGDLVKMDKEKEKKIKQFIISF